MKSVLIRVNPWLKNEKGCLFKGKSTKIAAAFMQNKPNFKNIKIGVSSFETSKYEILTAWRSKKQTQYKANTNPILERPRMNLRNAIKMNYKDFVPMASKKQSQFKPKTNPICRKGKIDANCAFTKEYNNETSFRLQKQTQTNPI